MGHIKYHFLDSRIRYCLLDENKERLLRSVLGMDGMAVLPTLIASAHRAWSNIPLAAARAIARGHLIPALEKIRFACVLPLDEQRVLQEASLFYRDLAKQFPDMQYAEIEALARRFKRDRQRGKSTEKPKLALTDGQASSGSAFLGLNGDMPFRGTAYAFARTQLSEHADNKQISLVTIRSHLAGVYRKIQHAWQLPETEYGELITSNAWFAKLAEKFPERTQETLRAIQTLLQIDAQNVFQQRREAERNEVLSVYQTELWQKLSRQDQKLLTLFYNLDSAGGTRPSAQVARILGITPKHASVLIIGAKYRLIALQPNLLLGSHANSSYTGNVWMMYHRDVMRHPALDDTAVQQYAAAMARGDIKSREALFHFGLRFLFPVAQKWQTSRGIQIWRQTGQSTLDFIQEANIGFYHALPSFVGNTAEQLRQFTEFAGDRAIRIALRYRGVSVGISREFTSKIRHTNKAWTRLFKELKREPTSADIAEYLGVSREEVEDTLAATNASVIATRSLDAPLAAEEEDNRTLHDILPDASANPEEHMLEQEKEVQLNRSLDALTYALMHKLSGIEQKVVMLRFGFQNNGEETSLPSMAESIGASEDDTAQILNTALWKLRADPQLQTAVQQLSL